MLEDDDEVLSAGSCFQGEGDVEEAAEFLVTRAKAFENKAVGFDWMKTYLPQLLSRLSDPHNFLLQLVQSLPKRANKLDLIFVVLSR